MKFYRVFALLLVAAFAVAPPSALQAAPNEATPDLGFSQLRSHDPHHLGSVSMEGSEMRMEVQSGADCNITLGSPTAPYRSVEATGNFETQVTLQPIDWLETGVRGPGPWEWIGAGLLVLNNEDNYIRFDHGVLRDRGGELRQVTIFEQVQNGKKTARSMEMSDLRYDPEKPLTLRLRREANRLEATLSNDQTHWIPIYPLNISGLADSLRVGVMAMNTTSAPFTFRFSDFKLQNGSSTVQKPPPFPVIQPIPALNAGATLPAPWGTPLDPEGVASFRVEGNSLLAEVAGVAADFSTFTNIFNGPRVLSEVEGDFGMEITIDPISKPDGHQLGGPVVWNSAGLFVGSDERNYIHIAHGVINETSGSRRDRLMFTLTTPAGGGAGRDFENVIFDQNKPLRLRLERRGRSFYGYLIQEGKEIGGSKITLPNDWPSKLRAGPIVLNTTTRTFNARLSDFKLAKQLPSFTEQMALEDLPQDGKLTGPWGIFMDPDHASTVKATEHELTIAFHGTPTDFGTQVQNAPRAVAPIADDFTVQVLVDPVAPPSGAAPLAGNDRWNGAGVVLSLNNRNFLRFTRTLVIRKDGATEAHLDETLRIAGVDEYRNWMDRWPHLDPVQPIWLRIQRHGSEITSSYGMDGQHWIEMSAFSTPDWPATLHSGVLAVGTTTEPYTARFRELSVAGNVK